MQDVPSEEYCEGGGALHSYRCPFFVNNGSYCRCHYYGKWLTEAVWTVRRPPECLADFPHGAVVELKKKESEKTGNDPKEKDGKDVTMDIHGRERGTPSAYDDADWF